MHIGFLVERRYLRQEMPTAVIRALRRRGVHSDVICPVDSHFEPLSGLLHCRESGVYNLNDYDVLVGRTRSGLGLAMLAYADAAGLLAINTHASTQRVRNKAKMAIALGQAGVPCAPTILADHASALTDLPARWFPLILKATYGDNSQGLRLIRRAEDLADIHWGEKLALAQHYLPNDGFDLKLYVVDETVFAVRKPSPFNGQPGAKPERVMADADMVRLAHRCGATFGLKIYGIDTIETPDGLAVIEVNEFPNFTGIPEAADHIADYILAQADTGGGADHAYRVLSGTSDA